MKQEKLTDAASFSDAVVSGTQQSAFFDASLSRDERT